ncbi:MAG: hypothetical protein WD873_00205 [Candidatus Hydrogenedentales bacterium]
MPLRDHFHPPLSAKRHWTSLHSAWANALATDLNGALPERYFAEPCVHFGIEIDVATLEKGNSAPSGAAVGYDWPMAPWTPPEPVLTVPFAHTTDIVEVAVYDNSEGPNIVGALELISPANKDRQEHPDAFVSKCETLVQEGIGLIIVDIVTNRHADLHAALMKRIAKPFAAGVTAPLYVSAYRPVERNGGSSLEVWHEALSIAAVLPTMPLWLRGGPCMPVNLETTYKQMCHSLRIGDAL